MKEYIDKIHEMEQMTRQEGVGQQTVSNDVMQRYLKRQELLLHPENRGDEEEKSTELEQGQNEQICEHLKEMLLVDTEADAELKRILPEAHRKKDEELERLNLEANRSGTEKLKHDFLGRQRKAAKARLMEIGKRRGEVQARRSGKAVYVPAKRKELERGKHKMNLFRAITNACALGTYDERHAQEQYAPVVGSTLQKKEITTDSYSLKGALYQNQNQASGAGKLVIVYSGSGAPGPEMIRSIVPSYVQAGASVLHFSYRGFGSSQSLKNGKKTGTHLCEDSLYQDGHAIFNYAVKTLGYAPSNIILHGFSLGGAVAAKVAADIAKENAMKLGEGTEITEFDRLGGLVLHSAIGTMSQAAGGGLTGWIGSLGSGNYDTKSHMRHLHESDPNLPVHFRGGPFNGNEDERFDDDQDHLSLKRTKLDQDAKAHFENFSSYEGTEGHLAGNQAANMRYGQNAIRELVANGRKANLRNIVEE